MGIRIHVDPFLSIRCIRNILKCKKKGTIEKDLKKAAES